MAAVIIVLIALVALIQIGGDWRGGLSAGVVAEVHFNWLSRRTDG
jgi:hypothetical protein